MPDPALLATHEWPSAAQTDAGAPAPVAVLVHGIAGWWHTWWRVGPALAERGWRVLAVDLRGHGSSPPISGVVTAASLADDLAATLAAVAVTPVDLVVAHSLGAAVTMELAHRDPAFARRVVLEDPPGQTRVDDVDYQAHLEREVLAARADPAAEVRRALAENPAWLPEDARQDAEGRARCDLDGILASLRADTGVRAPVLAPLLRIPALYLVAAADRSALGAQRSALLASLPPRAAAIEFDTGHVVHRDAFETYVAAIERWVGTPIDAS